VWQTLQQRPFPDGELYANDQKRKPPSIFWSPMSPLVLIPSKTQENTTKQFTSHTQKTSFPTKKINIQNLKEHPFKKKKILPG